MYVLPLYDQTAAKNAAEKEKKLMTKKARLTAILAAALAVSSMAVSAIWLDHTSGSAGSIECHGYLYSYSDTSYGTDTTASATPYSVSTGVSVYGTNRKLLASDYDRKVNQLVNGVPITNYTFATASADAGSGKAVASVQGEHSVNPVSGSDFYGTTTH